MSDYLENLVAKSRNRANVIQPRPATLFEPVSPGGPLANGPSFAGFGEELTERFAPPSQPAGLGGASVPIRSSLEARLPVIGVRQSAPATPSLRTAAADAILPRDPVLAASSQTPNPMPASVSSRRPSGGATEGAHRTITPSPTDAPQSTLTPRNDSAPALIVTSRARTVSVFGAVSNLHSGPQTTSQDEPTIKISIGRVDVRAIMPAPRAAPSLSPSRAPSLSLDDYLKRQNREKR